MPGGAIITGGHGGGYRRGHHRHEGQGPEEEHLPIEGEAMEEEAQGGGLLLLSHGGAAVIIFINITIIITILISFTRSTLPQTAVIPYLNMELYATYYDPMMCCHPMMFLVHIFCLWVD